MVAKKENPLWGLLSGAVVGTVLGLAFSPVVAGPALGVLVGVKALRLPDLLGGLRAGTVMGALMGLAIALYTLIDLKAEFEPAAWSNFTLASVAMYALIGAAAGAAAGKLVKWTEGKSFLF
ncbi:MAG TPA: hypothetical protein VF813_05110 [Anaerolineaceae bacterium]